MLLRLAAIAAAAFLICTCVIVGANAADPPAMTQEQRDQALRALQWRDPGTYKLPLSDSSLALPAEHRLLIGEDARQLEFLVGNGQNARLEAIVIDRTLKNQVNFEAVEDGFIKLDD
jgi:uncharacterized membrane-anchored protein